MPRAPSPRSGRPRRGLGFLAYTLISAFANIGIDTIVSEFQGADWWLLLTALVLSPLSQIPQAFSTMGATLHEIRFWPRPDAAVRGAVHLARGPQLPARLALEVRFWERVGVPGAGALSIGMLDSFSTFVIQILLIVLILASDAVTLNLATDTAGSSGDSSGFNWSALLTAILLVVAALGIAYLFPKTRAKLHRFRETLREKWADAKEALRVLRLPSQARTFDQAEHPNRFHREHPAIERYEPSRASTSIGGTARFRASVSRRTERVSSTGTKRRRLPIRPLIPPSSAAFDTNLVESAGGAAPSAPQCGP